MEIVNKDNFDEVVNRELVLIDFYADWCGPCKMLTPNLEKLEKTNGILVKKVNVDNSRELAKKYGVMTIPTLILFSNGSELKRHVGFSTVEELEKFISEYN